MAADIAHMQFWGVEVKPGQSLKVDPYTDSESEIFDSSYIHLSQAALGDSKKDKGSEPVVLFVTFGGQKLVLGTLSKDNVPQLSFDLVLEKEFELSHNWKNGNVCFLGYKAHTREAEEIDDDFEDESEDEDLPLPIKENGKPAAKIEEAKPAAPVSVQKAGASQKQVKVVDPKKDQEEEPEDDEDDEEDESGSSDKDMMEADSDSDGDEDSDSDEDDEDTPPAKGNLEKKRPNDSASKTPLPAKKAKSSTPQKTDGKKGGYTATPHPMKKGGKTPNSDSKDQTPKSGGQISCKSCSKTFTSESGLQQHSKAKHGGQ